MADTFPTRSNLVRLSRLMAWLATIGAVLAPLLDAFLYLAPGTYKALSLSADHMGSALNDGVPLFYRLAALAFSLGAEAFMVWALWSLRNLFLRYASGEVFSPAALKALNHVAIALFASVIVGFVVRAPISVLLTWPLGEGHRALSLEIGSDDVVTMFIAATVLVIARVMNEAGRIAEENAKFV
ncbi:MAG TPA: DUF2975 domain-containing protein [Rhizomicrobium sp.]|jgi:hypothetical protein|nr:DUF2975 domain-containing protein [Rhizomicrobium sp.]